jgi:ketosteroid isomerase-like protein
MKKITQLVVVMFVMLLLSGISYTQQWSDAQKEVWAGVEKYWEVSAAGNVAGFMSYFDDSYMGWDYQSKVPQNKSTTGKWINYGLSNYTTVVYSLSPVTIWVKGDFAYVHYYYAEVDKNNETGKKENNSGNWTDILMKSNGKWVLIGDHGGRTSKSSND